MRVRQPERPFPDDPQHRRRPRLPDQLGGAVPPFHAVVGPPHTTRAPEPIRSSMVNRPPITHPAFTASIVRKTTPPERFPFTPSCQQNGWLRHPTSGGARSFVISALHKMTNHADHAPSTGPARDGTDERQRPSPRRPRGETAAHTTPAAPDDPAGHAVEDDGEAVGSTGEDSDAANVSQDVAPAHAAGGDGEAAGSAERPAGEGAEASDEDEADGEEPGEGPAGGGDRKRRRRVWRWVAVGAVAVLLVGGGGAAWLYHDLVGGIDQERVDDRLGANRPEKLNKSLNILLIGSDTREGENSEYAVPGMAGARSDTTILLHLSPNRDQAVGISFPRDSMVKIPACKKEKGGTVPAQFGMLNAAFAFAGPTCTWKTLESLTGIHIDHFVQVDFAGFKRMVDALGVSRSASTSPSTTRGPSSICRPASRP